MLAMLRSFLISRALVRVLLRLLPCGPKVVIRGYDSRRIPASIVPFIVENVDAKRIHRDAYDVRIDGGAVHDLIRLMPAELNLRQLVGLWDASDIGIESAACSMVGDVVIETHDKALVARAQTRGSGAGFDYAELTLTLAAHAAAVSGRPLSGAY